MGVELRQDDQMANCFIVTLHAGWTWGEIKDTSAAIAAAQQQLGDVPVHIFTEIEEPISMPDDIELNAMTWLKHHVRVHRGLLVFVTEWDMVRSLIKLMSLGQGNPLSFIHFAHSVEEARAVVQHWEAPS